MTSMNWGSGFREGNIPGWRFSKLSALIGFVKSQGDDSPRLEVCVHIHKSLKLKVDDDGNKSFGG